MERRRTLGGPFEAGVRDFKSLLIEVCPHPAEQLGAGPSLVHQPAGPGTTKTWNQDTYHGHQRARSAVFYDRPITSGERAWHGCEHEVAYHMGVHKYPRWQRERSHGHDIIKDVHSYRSLLSPTF